MTLPEGRHRNEMLKELLEKSQAWLRLQEHASEKADQEFSIFKSDVATVFQQMMYATFTLQQSVAALEDHAVKQDQTLEDWKKELDLKHQLLVDKLFDPDEGTFINIRRYIDEKIGKITAVQLAVGTSIVAGVVVLLITRLVN